MSKSKLNKQTNKIFADIEAAIRASDEARDTYLKLSYGASQLDADILHRKMVAARDNVENLKAKFKFKNRPRL